MELTIYENYIEIGTLYRKHCIIIYLPHHIYNIINLNYNVPMTEHSEQRKRSMYTDVNKIKFNVFVHDLIFK